MTHLTLVYIGGSAHGCLIPHLTPIRDRHLPFCSEMGYKCEICNYMFATLAFLNDHFKCVHTRKNNVSPKKVGKERKRDNTILNGTERRNERERKRINTILNAYEKLTQEIPFAREKNTSRQYTLHMCIKYINLMTEEVTEESGLKPELPPTPISDKDLEFLNDF